MCRNSGWVRFLRTFSSCLKSDVNLIWNSWKRANALVKIFFAEKYFRVRFLILLYFVLSIENCLIWAFVSDCICFFLHENISICTWSCSCANLENADMSQLRLSQVPLPEYSVIYLHCTAIQTSFFEISKLMTILEPRVWWSFHKNSSGFEYSVHICI